MAASIILGSLLLIVSLFTSSSHAGCTGNPPMYNGLPCATTTRYWDGQMGACGCGSSGQSPFSWQWTSHTAAASQAIYSPSGSSWCGSGCGTCFEITPTGDCPYGPPCAVQNAPVTIMVSNLCPYEGNEVWCPNPGNANSWGYHAHFDLMDYNMNGWVDSLGWNNPVVTYRQVPCGGGGSPSCSQAASCECPLNCTGGSTPSASSSTSSTVSTLSSSSSSSSGTPSTPSTPATSTSTSSTSSSSSSGSCRAGISFALSSTWNDGGSVTITISNTGSSPIQSLQVNVAGTSSSWNLASTGTENVYTFPPWAFPIAPGSQYTSSGYTFTGTQPAAGSIVSISC